MSTRVGLGSRVELPDELMTVPCELINTVAVLNLERGRETMTPEQIWRKSCAAIYREMERRDISATSAEECYASA